MDGLNASLRAWRACPSENVTPPASLDAMPIDLAALGPNHCAGPPVDEVGAITSSAGYWGRSSAPSSEASSGSSP